METLTEHQQALENYLSTQIEAEKNHISPLIRQAGRILNERLVGQWEHNPLAFFYRDQEFVSYTVHILRALDYLRPEVLGLFRSVWNAAKSNKQPEHIDCNILRSKPSAPERIWTTIFVFSDPTPGLVRAQMGPDNVDIILKPGHIMAQEVEASADLARLKATFVDYPETAARLGLMLAENASDRNLITIATRQSNPLFVH